METKIVKINKEIKKCNALKNLVWQRTATAEEWIPKHASGTLNKNKRLGMTWRNQYIEERIAYQYGWEFEIQPRSRIMFGDAFTEGDESAVTEAGWHIERYIATNPFPEDKFECKYINVEYAHGEKRKESELLFVKQVLNGFQLDILSMLLSLNSIQKKANGKKQSIHSKRNENGYLKSIFKKL